jgi:hypothetical protein
MGWLSLFSGKFKTASPNIFPTTGKANEKGFRPWKKSGELHFRLANGFKTTRIYAIAR